MDDQQAPVYRKRTSPHYRRYIYYVAAGVLVLLSVAVAVHLLRRPPAIPRKVLQEAGFGVWYPSPGASAYKVDEKTVQYSAQSGGKLITFQATSASGNQLFFTEQAEPENFVDIPQVYQKLTEKLRAYSNFNSVNGAVYITHPEELNGGQTALMDAKGTLIFIKPKSDLSVDAWHDIINTLSFTN